MRAERFEDALASLAAILKERGVPYALMGGLAVAAWGVPRATEDIDLLADASPSPELDAALGARGFQVEWRRGAPAGGPGDLADVADLLQRAGPLPDLDQRAAARGVADLLRQVRASTGNQLQSE